MKFASATNLDRKSGGTWGTRAEEWLPLESELPEVDGDAGGDA